MIEVIDIGEDQLGPFMRVRVYLKDGERVIRWGLDAFTYEGLSPNFHRFSRPHSNPPSFHVTLQCGWDTRQGQFTGRLVQTAKETSRATTFPCSKLFAANLRWLEKVSSVTQIGQDLLEPQTTTGPPEFATTAAQPGLILVADEPSTTATIAVCRRHRKAQRRASPGRLTAVTLMAIAGVAAVPIYMQISEPRPPVPATASALSATFHTVSTQRAFTPVFQQAPLSLELIQSEALKGKVTAPSGAKDQHPSNVPAKSKSVTAKRPLNSASAATTTSDQTAPAPIVWSVPKGNVALSFDDGPSPYTTQIVNILNQYHVHATFFFVGQRVNWWPESVLAVAQSGDEIGNHSLSHPQLPKLSTAGQTTQITKTNQIIANLTGKSVYLFRPPYGEYDKTTEQLISTNHMAIAMWNRDPRDWATHSAKDVIKAFFSVNPSGGIYDMHETPETVKALPTIIRKLQVQHLNIVMMPEPNPQAQTSVLTSSFARYASAFGKK